MEVVQLGEHGNHPQSSTTTHASNTYTRRVAVAGTGTGTGTGLTRGTSANTYSRSQSSSSSSATITAAGKDGQVPPLRRVEAWSEDDQHVLHHFSAPLPAGRRR